MNLRDAVLTLAVVTVGGVGLWSALRTRDGGAAARGAPLGESSGDLPGAPAPVATSQPAPAPVARTDGVRSVTGRIVAVDGGAAIGGARVVVVIASAPGRALSWLVSDSSRDGTFDVPLGATEVGADAAIEVRVRAAGYQSWRAPLGVGVASQGGAPALTASLALTSDVRLERLARDLIPGRIAGRVLDSEGSRVAGPLALQGFDEFLSLLRRSALADERGAFVLEGVPPGTWSLALGDDTSRTDVTVAEGAEGRVELRTRSRHLAEPAFTDVRGLLAEFRDVEARARRLEDDAKTAKSEERRAEIARSLADTRRTFDALGREMRRALPHREVIVRGVPDGRRAWVAAPADFGEWVVEALASRDPLAGARPRTLEACIPWMPVGPARIEVRVLDAQDDAFEVEIVEGKGPQVVVVPSR